MKWSIKSFNELTVNELYEICKARYEVFGCEQKIYQENDLDDIDKKAFHLFLQDGDKVAAYARIIPKETAHKEVSIGRVLVLKDYRRKGFAVELMNRAVDFAKYDLKAEKVVVSAQYYVKELYEKLGFKIVSEIYNEVEIPHVKMILE